MDQHDYYLPAAVEEAVQLLTRYRDEIEPVAGGTDLLVAYHQGRPHPAHLVDVTRIPELHRLEMVQGQIVVGAAVTHARLATAPLIQQHAPLLAQAGWQIGSPLVRNTGTIGGNLGTASPAGDCLPPLVALEAEVEIAGPEGRRRMPVEAFTVGVKKKALNPGEMIVALWFKPLAAEAASMFLKFGLRRGQAIAVTSTALILETEGQYIKAPRLAVGAVSPRVERLRAVETWLLAKSASADTYQEAGNLAADAVRPIDDVRGSAAFRRHLIKVLVQRGLEMAAAGEQPLVREGVSPFILGPSEAQFTLPPAEGNLPLTDVACTINDTPTILTKVAGKSLLQALREVGGLVGTKDGCSEGECGACTVLLDGRAVLACLLPAGAAHGRTVRTVEGLGEPEKLNRLQQAFIEAGAVQCGYCTPGLLMSATALLESGAAADRGLIREAISGNICRCTGYEKVVDAIQLAAQRREEGSR